MERKWIAERASDVVIRVVLEPSQTSKLFVSSILDV